MRIPRPAAEKLGVDRQDPDLDGLLFGLIRRATGGCHEHAARLAHPQVGGKGRGLKISLSPALRLIRPVIARRAARTVVRTDGASTRLSSDAP